jgi:hypothetical protein
MASVIVSLLIGISSVRATIPISVVNGTNPGDINIDGSTDVGDLGVLAANYGKNLIETGAPQNQWWSKGDLNNDGLVDVGDLGILASNYGTSGGGPAFIYQKDVSGNQDGNSIIADADLCEFTWFENNEDSAPYAYLTESIRANQAGCLLHFRAPAWYPIKSVQVFTRSYIWSDHWEDVQLFATCGTTPHHYLWEYMNNDTRFYYRDKSNGGVKENLTTITTSDITDLYLTFSTYQNGYYGNNWVKQWFRSPGTAAHPDPYSQPGLKVTLNLTPATPALSIAGHQILVNGSPLQGIFVNWHTPAIDFEHNETWFRSEFKKMKSYGISGIGLEIGWNICEPQDNSFTFGALPINKVIDWAGKEGLWVHLLLTPHYTPNWLTSKYGDIRMKDASGQSCNGSFLTFSPWSPAVYDQIDFQSKAIQYFQKYPNILAFFLTNEQSIGMGQNRSMLDYSIWAQNAWHNWLVSINSTSSYWQTRWNQTSVDPRTTPLPTTLSEGRKWQDWQLFRQQQFNKYLNQLYDGAVQGRSRFIPIGHKCIFYNAFDAYAREYALHYSPLQTKMDIVGCDAYGSNPTMMAAELAQKKPILLAETNFTSTPSGADGQSVMAGMLFSQYAHGAFLQTIYSWNNYDESSFSWGMFYSNGSPLTGTLGVATSAKVIDVNATATGPIPAQSALLIPVDRFNTCSDQAWVFQNPYNNLLETFDKCGIYSHVLYADDVVPSAYIGRSGQGISLTDYKIISAMSTSESTDQSVLASTQIQNWVNSGGVLFIEYFDGTLPSWIGITASTTTKTTYSYASGATYLRCTGQSRSSGISYRLSTNVSGNKILARWDGSTDNAIIAVPCGTGWVIVAGTPLFDMMSSSTVQPLLWDILSLTGDSTLPVSPMGPTYLATNDTLYLKTDSDWSGTINLPGNITQVDSINQYDANALPCAATISLNGSNLSGTLLTNQFCVIKFISTQATQQDTTTINSATGLTVVNDQTQDTSEMETMLQNSSSSSPSVCSAVGLPLIAGFLLAGMMILSNGFKMRN